VVYVNFGSITVVTRERMDEFAWGLADVGCPFLWVVRPDMVRDGGGWALPAGFEDAVAGRGMTAGWCDQEAVLEQPLQLELHGRERPRRRADAVLALLLRAGDQLPVHVR
jgi:hypothetical protein